MKKVIFLILFLFKCIILNAEIGTNWEKLNGGMIYNKDTISDKNDYLFTATHLYGYFDRDYYLGSNQGFEPLVKLDSNTYARVSYQNCIKFPKNGEYFDDNIHYKWPIVDLVNEAVHIEITRDRLKNWQRIYSFKINTCEPFSSMYGSQIDTLCGFNLNFTNDLLYSFMEQLKKPFWRVNINILVLLECLKDKKIMVNGTFTKSNSGEEQIHLSQI